MALKSTYILLCVVFVFNGYIQGSLAQKKARTGKRVTVTVLNRRLQATEQQLGVVTSQLTATKARLEQLEQRLQRLEAGGGAGGGSSSSSGAAEVQKFSDLPPCPDIDGFYLADSMRSCYHLQPASVLANYSVAVATCTGLNPKAHVVAIDSEEEQSFLNTVWFNERGIASISRFWINLKKTPNRNQWKWEHDNRMPRYTHWIPTTSHNDDRFQCAAVYSNEAYFWGDVACWGPHMITCEVDM